MNSNNKHHHIAIVGAGLGGLTAAAFLEKEGIDFHIYEQAAKLEEVGAGINLDSNATRILKQLGLEEKLMEVSVPLDQVWEFRNWVDGEVLYQEPFDTKFETPHVVVHRGDLQNVLKQAIPKEKISLNKRCVGVEQNNNKATVTFDNGLTVKADIVIGADGPHSAVRKAVVNPPPKNFRGAIYRSLVPIDQISPDQRVPNRTAWIGGRNFFMRYPVSNGKLLNIAAGVHRDEWVYDSSRVNAKVEDFLKEFDDWDEDIRALIQTCPETELWALYDMDPLERWSLNRVTLLGDAAHFMLPYLGQGAAQAMEDATVLAGCLKNMSKNSDVSKLLKQYERVRKPRATIVQTMARLIWDIVDTPGADLQSTNLYGGDVFNIYKGLFNMHDWLNGYRIEKDASIYLESSRHEKV